MSHFLKLIDQEISKADWGNEPTELYEPIRYILDLGGKRLRPQLVLTGYSLFRADIERILKPSLAVEVFHNFTLMHDDIMDNAPLRRGMATVHEKWDVNTAILSGDVMFVKAYDLVTSVPVEFLPKVLSKFNQCARQVCEGQQWDMNFENKATVTEQEYLNMIRLKTAVLLGFSLEFGALMAGAEDSVCAQLNDVATLAGIGFQLKDDLLDVYADQDKFGKQVGGDIISNKKTYLLIKALELANREQLNELKYWLDTKEFDKVEKVNAVKSIYDQMQIDEISSARMDEYFDRSLTKLRALPMTASSKEPLELLLEKLINREK